MSLSPGPGLGGGKTKKKKRKTRKLRTNQKLENYEQRREQIKEEI
jgi:hypothetical protein